MKALVVSGGSVKGSYSLGCLKYLLNDLENKYDILSGISSGGIIVAYLSQFEIGQEKEAITSLINMWLGIKKFDIYKVWSIFKRIQSVWKYGVYDSTPLHNLVKKHILLEKIRQAHREVLIGSVNLHTGKYLTFDQHDNDFILSVIASASIPGIFPPVQINNHLYIDGGIKSMSPIKAAIDKGATEIDLIVTSPETRISKFTEKPNIVEVLKRALDLATDKIMYHDIQAVIMYNKLVAAGLEPNKKEIKINIIRPKFNLIEDLLDFDPIKIKQMMDIGYNDAKEYFENLDKPA